MLLNDIDTNLVYVADGLRSYTEASKNLFKALDEEHIPYRFLPRTESPLHVWARDYMPLQTADRKHVGYAYDPDYLLEEPEYIPDVDGILEEMALDTEECLLRIDGGNVVKCGDKVVMTDKVFHENRHLSKEEVLDRLHEAFESEIVFIPWDKNEPYGHADGMVRYLGNGMVLLNDYVDFDKALRKRLLAALEPHFVVAELHYEMEHYDPLSWAYINFLQVGQHIFLPQLDLPEDQIAFEQVAHFCPKMKVHPIRGCEAIAADGSALNSVTWSILY